MLRLYCFIVIVVLFYYSDKTRFEDY